MSTRGFGLILYKHDSEDTSEFFKLSYLLLTYSFYLRVAVAIASFKCNCCKCCPNNNYQ